MYAHMYAHYYCKILDIIYNFRNGIWIPLSVTCCSYFYILRILFHSFRYFSAFFLSVSFSEFLLFSVSLLFFFLTLFSYFPREIIPFFPTLQPSILIYPPSCLSNSLFSLPYSLSLSCVRRPLISRSLLDPASPRLVPSDLRNLPSYSSFSPQQILSSFRKKFNNLFSFFSFYEE